MGVESAFGRFLATVVRAAAARTARCVSLAAISLAMPVAGLAQVQGTTTTLQLTVSGLPVASVAAGAAVKLTASVTGGGAAVHPGTIQFCDMGAAHCTNAALLGSAQLTAAGTASIVVRLAAGSRRIGALFVGNKSYGGSTSSVSGLAVTGARPTTSSLAFGGVQGNYTLTGTVTSTMGPGFAPTGSLSFQDTSNANAVVATGSLVANVNVAGLTLTSSPATPTGGAIVAADLNGDGLPDLIVPQQVQTYQQKYPLTILLNKGDGTFTTQTTAVVPESVTVVRDFNNDGIPDIFSASQGDGSYTVLLGKGDGTFTTGPTGPAGPTLLGYGPQAVSGDFNGDGNLDIALVTLYGVQLLLGNGDGSFTAQANPLPITQNQVTIQAVDFNGDGLTDLALADATTNTVTIYLSKGDGTFSVKATYPTGNQPYAMVTADFNNDGIADLATSNEPIGTLTVLLGNGDGTFRAAPPTAAVPASLAAPGSNGPLGPLAVGDLNGDGIPDLLSLNTVANTALVLLGKGDGSFILQTAMPTIVSGGGTALVAFADFNGDGAVDLAALDQNVNITRILLNHIQSSATATATGVAIPGAGTHAVDSVYPGDSLYSGSTSATVTLDVPQTATTLSLTAFPGVATYGRQVVFTAKLSPASMGTITTVGEAITFYNAGVAIGTGTLASGVATFSTSALAIGTSPISAGFAGDATFLASSSAPLNFSVSAPGAPTVTSLVATANGATATSVAAGTSITYTATVLAGGVPLYAGQVTFCNSGAAYCLGSNVLGTASLLANGTATVKLRPSVGAHGVRAVFAGTQSYAGSSSSVASVTVTGLQPSTAALAVTGSTGAYLLTATITGSGLSSGPTGTLTFLDTSTANSPVGTAGLGAGTLTRSFLMIASPATGAAPAGIVSADFNNDGIPDFATINASANTVTILLGTGMGTTTALPAIATGGTGGLQLVAGDFNGDGIADLTVLSAQGPVEILLGNGDGTFTAHSGPTISGPLAIAAADLDGDGVLDLAIGTSANTVVVAHGNGDGSFTLLSAAASTGNQPAAIAVGDFNHDGTPDLAVANLNDNTISLLLGNGDGTFAVQTATLATGSHPAALLAVDTNGDGLLDLIAANQSAGTCTIFLGTASGGFTLKQVIACGSNPVALAGLDVNGDGVPDVAIANGATPGKVTVLTGNGDGTFTASTVVPTVGNNPSGLVAVDVNADGIPDLAVVNGAGATVSIALGQLSESATATLGSRVVVNNGVVTTGGGLEIPGAGIHNVDAVFAGDNNYSGSTSAAVALNGSQTPTTLQLQSTSPLSSFGQTVTFVAVLNPFAVDAATTNGQTVTFNDSGAAIGTATLSNGVASFSTATLAVGLHSITASYAGDTNFVAATSAPATPARVLSTRAVTSTMLSVVANGAPVTTIAQGTPVTLTATVMGAGKPASPGTVNFCSASAATCTGPAFYGSAQVTSSGVARLVLRPGKGGYQYVARFAGDNNFASSASSPVALSVPTTSATTFAATGTPGNYTLTATVAGSGSFSSPAGVVSFLDTTNGSAAFATAGLSGGKLTQAFTVATANFVPYPVATGDFNNDGLPDLLYAQGGVSVGSPTGPFGVLLSNGDGTYTNKVISPTSTSPAFIVGDFNNDGNLDFVLLNTTVLNPNAGTTAQTYQVYLGHGDGTFTAMAAVSLPIANVSTGAADFDGDGNLDLVFLGGTTSTPAEAYVLLGHGDGTFTAVSSPTASNGNGATPLIADFNRDGIPDVAFVQLNQVSLLLGNGDGTFTPKVTPVATPYLVAGEVPAVADFNGDGIPDLAVPEYQTGNLTILLGNGDGSFRLGVTTPSLVAETQYAVAADLNGDGFADVAITDYFNGNIEVFYGNGDGTLTAPSIFPTVSKGLTSLMLADFNGDGLPDLLTYRGVFTGNATIPVSLLYNSASYTASAVAANVSVPGTGIHYVEASYPGSSAYLASISSTLPLTAEPPIPPPAPAPPTTLGLSVNPVEGTYQQPVILTATLSPFSLAGASTNGETVNFLRDNVIVGTGTLSGGVATFTTSTLPGGTSSLSAAYNGDTSFAASVSASTSLLVTPASAMTTLAITAGGQPVGSVAAGTLVTLTVGVMHGSSAVASALVNLCDAAYVTCVGPGLLGTVQVSGGSASMKLRFATGIHRIDAQLVPQANYSTSVSLTSTLTVTGSGATTTTLAAAGQQGVYTLTATTTGLARATAPTGPVSFYDVTRANTLLGTATLGAGTLARTFVPQSTTLVQNLPSDIVTADFNGDGIPDVAVLTEFNYQPTSVTILLGDGKGGFTALAPIEFGSQSGAPDFARTMAVGDFNHDGVPDLAVGVAPGTVAILLGTGNGTFTQAAPLVVGGLSSDILQSGVAIADINGDGVADILAFPLSILVGTSPVVFLGHGDGTFGSPIGANNTNVGIIAYQLAFAVGDFNGDGMVDYALATSASSGTAGNTMNVFFGKGDGTFTASPQNPITLPGMPDDIQTGDFNGDGVLDLVVTISESGKLTILLGNGDGTFTFGATPTVTTNASHVTVTDFNGDGIDDLAVTQTNSGVGVVTVLLGNGDGTFSRQGPDAATGSYPYGLVAADFNGDGQTDIATANLDSDSVSLLLNQLTETTLAYLPNARIVGAGVHQVDAVYAGDSTFAAGTSNTLLLNGVSATSTALTLASNAASSNYGGSVVLTATLAPTGSPGTNGEVVTFSSGSKVLGTAPLAAGLATLATTALPAGGDSVTASYPGDFTYASAVSNAVAIAVAQATSSIGYVPAAGQIYGVPAGTAGILNATGTPSGGTATYTATGASGTIALNAATLLPAGTYSLTATYTPADAIDYAASSKTVAGYVVSRATPTIAWSTPASIVYGTQLSGVQLNANSTVAGSFAYSPAAGAVLGAGPHSIAATFTPTDAADYTTASATVTLQVTQATPAIVWPTPANIAFGTALSATQLNASSTVQGTFVYTPPAGTVLSAGSHALQATFTPADSVDYTPATAMVTVVVGQAAPTITWATPAPIVYGTALSATQLNASTTVPGTFAYTPAVGTVLHAGPQTLGVTFTPTDGVTYGPATASVTLQVTRATPSIAWATPPAITYGVALSGTQLNATTGTSGTFAYTPAAGALLTAGPHALSVVLTPLDAVDFTTATASVTLQVNPAVPAIAWATPAPVAYGTVLSATQLNATANVSGTFTYQPAAGTALTTVGAQTLTATFAPSDTADYTTATASVSLQVTQATPTITWGAPASIVYGTALSATQLNATANAAGTFVYSPAAGTVLPAGMQVLKATFTPANSSVYAAATATVTLPVNPVPLTITAAGASRVYGAANPSFTYSAIGFVNQDTAAVLSGVPVETTAATTASAPGSYAIVAAQGTLAAANYSLSFANGVLTVTQAASATLLTLSAATVPLGSPETIAIAVGSTTTGVPSGAVTLSDGTATLATLVLTNGQATFTTNSLSAGGHSLAAAYAGDTDFTASSATVALTVSAIPADFTFTSSGTNSQSVLPGASAAFSFALAPTQSGYPGMIGFAVSGLPSGASASFSPASLAAGGTAQSAVMTVRTPASLAVLRSAAEGRVAAGLLFALLLLPLASARRMRRASSGLLRVGVWLLLSGSLLAGLGGCGSGTGFFAQSPHTYPLVVTASGGTLQHSLTVSLTVE
jgi:hypothetical protein